jgi:hypothetical protein
VHVARHAPKRARTTMNGSWTERVGAFSALLARSASASSAPRTPTR